MSYTSPEQPGKNANPNLVPMIIKMALMFSVVIYVLIVVSRFGVPEKMIDFQKLFSDPSKLALLMAALGSIVAAKVLKGVFDKKIEAAERTSTDKTSSVQARFVPMVIRLALFESVAIYGLVISFTSKDSSWAILFAMISLAMMSTVSSKLDDGRRL